MPLYIVTQQRRVSRRNGRQSILLRSWPEPVWLVYGQAPLKPRGEWREVRECEYLALHGQVWIAPYDAGHVHYRIIDRGIELASGVGPLDEATLSYWVARSARESAI